MKGSFKQAGAVTVVVLFAMPVLFVYLSKISRTSTALARTPNSLSAIGDSAYSDIMKSYKRDFMRAGTKCCNCDAILSGRALEKICSYDGKNASSVNEPVYCSSECTCMDYFYCKLVVVSSFSSSHLEEAKDMIASVHTHLPNTKIIVYSLGLTDKEEALLRRYCNLELRIFKFEKYPALKYSTGQQNLHKYGWKPLVVQEVSEEYEVALYFDSSVRLMGPINETILRYLLSSPSFVAGPYLGGKCARAVRINLPIVSYTHDGMLKYLFPNKSLDLPALRQELALWGHLQSGVWLMWFNSEAREKILKNWVDCALHEECMAPKTASRSGCLYDRIHAYAPTGKYIGCHRYDQSALNLILYREFGLTAAHSICHHVVFKLLSVERKPTHHYDRNICTNLHSNLSQS